MPEDGPSTSAYNVEDSRNSVVLSLRLKKGKVRSDNHTLHNIPRLPVPVCHRPEVLEDQERKRRRTVLCANQVKALLWVCTKTWQPQHLSCPLCGQLDNSAYEGWNEWQTEGPRSVDLRVYLVHA